jgi:glycosyltransferase involved in cell wall biosynthesis
VRILIVTQYFWPERFRINDLALGMKQRGHEVEVLTGMPNYPSGEFYPGYGMFAPARESFEGIPVLRVPLVRRGSSRSWRLAVNYASFALAASTLGPFRCRGRHDVIFVYEPSPVTVALPGIVLRALKRAPLLFWAQDLWPENLSATGAVKARWILKLVRRLVDFIYRRSDRVLISARASAAHVLASGIREDRIVYLPNWAESLYQPLEVMPDSVRAEMPQGFRVMFAGNIGSAQAFETIVAAAERLKGEPSIHWIVLGDGNMKSWVETQVRERGLERQFHLLGHRPVESMPGYFASADALLVSLRADPVFALQVPSKIQSYLACGRPIIASIDGESADIVTESGAGVSCPAEDPEKLAEAVLTLSRMPEDQRMAMGRKGRHYFESNFEREMLLDRLERLMLDISGKK